jgi:hypothetical protein
MALDDLNKIVKTIDGSVEEFVKDLPFSEQKIWQRVLSLTKQLQVDGLGKVTNNVANLRILNDINKEINSIVLTDEYKAKVEKFTSVFADLETLNNEYLSSVFTKFKPSKVLKELTKISIDITIDQLQETGVASSLTSELKEILKQNITTGGNYADMTEQLRESILGSPTTPGGLTRYARTFTTDAINQYSATYTKTVASDLGAVYYRYTGSNMETTRPFCEHLTKKDGGYFHVNEIPGFLKGIVGDQKVPIYAKYNLPQGMNENTTADNFLVLRGGYNCGHQIFPVSKASVPASLRSRFE